MAAVRLNTAGSVCPRLLPCHDGLVLGCPYRDLLSAAGEFPPGIPGPFIIAGVADSHKCSTLAKEFSFPIRIGTVFGSKSSTLDRIKESTNPNARITFTPIGTIRSPFTDISGMPIQPNGARGVRGTVEIFSEYAAGLLDLDGFSRVILIYAFHRSGSYDLKIIPFLDTTSRGVFATRAPKRPNAIGLSVIRLIEVQGRTLIVEDVDILDGTPLLDIKPYVPAFDAYPDASCGWLEKTANGVKSFRSDDRFE